MQDEEDVVLEPENNEPPKGGDAEVRLAKLKAEIEKLRTERQEYLDGWQRAKADYVNALKRFDGDVKSAKEGGVVKALEEFLPAYDGLERAKAAGELGEGFGGIAKQIESAFKALGLEQVGEVGEQFDPSLHEALGQDVAERAEQDDKITAVLQKGYKLGEHIVRPAKVRVAHFG